MNIIWSAPCDVSGYSYCARDYVLALGENGTNIQFHTPVISRLLEGLGIDHETKKRLSAYTNNEISEEYVRVWHSIPDRFAVDKNALLNIGYTVVETEKIPERWVFMCNQMDAIFTASEFCKRILIKNGVVVPVIVVPHCHDPKQFKTKSKYNITNLKSFNFLFMADMTPRKGWEQLIQAYCEEFKPNEDVSLTMKVYYGDFSDEAQLRCRNKIKQAAQRWGYHINHSTAPVYFYGHCLPNSCVPRFINTFDCIISPHCAEGWGLCLSPNTIVETDNSIKLIKDLKIGDIVSTRKGFRHVTNKFEKVDKTIKLNIYGNIPIEATEYHPILIKPRTYKQKKTIINKFDQIKSVWINAGHIKEGDFVAIPKPILKNNIVGSLDLSLYDNKCIFDDHYMWYKTGFSPTNKLSSYSNLCKMYSTKKHVLEKIKKFINGDICKLTSDEENRVYNCLLSDNISFNELQKYKRFIKFNKEFMYLVGWYIAEGSTDRESGRIELSMGEKDDKFIPEIVSIIYEIFNICPKVEYVGKKRKIRWVCKAFAKWLDLNCGKYAKNKKIPSLFQSTNSNVWHLLKGYFLGDGHKIKAKNAYSVATVSMELAFDIRRILLGNDIFCTIRKYINNFGNNTYEIKVSGPYCNKLMNNFNLDNNWTEKRNSSPILFSDSCYWVPVKNIDYTNCKSNVFDIEVDEDHEFIANGIVVHNCMSQGMLLGKPVIATDYSGNLEFMNADNSYLVKVGRIEKVPQEMIDINSNYNGAVWPVVDVDQLRATMRHAFENQKEAKKIGIKARKHIADNYSHKVVSSIIKRAIESLLDEKTKRNNSNIQHTGLGGNLS